LNDWNTDFIYYEIPSIVVTTGAANTYDVTFDYRCGDPFMNCQKATCVNGGDILEKDLFIDTPTIWQDYGTIDDVPHDTGNGNETLAGTCDTCGDDG